VVLLLAVAAGVPKLTGAAGTEAVAEEKSPALLAFNGWLALGCDCCPPTPNVAIVPLLLLWVAGCTGAAVPFTAKLGLSCSFFSSGLLLLTGGIQLLWNPNGLLLINDPDPLPHLPSLAVESVGGVNTGANHIGSRQVLLYPN